MRNERGARKYTSTSAAAMYKTVNPSSTAVKKLPPTSICRQAKQSRYMAAWMPKQRFLVLRLRNRVEDVVKAQVCAVNKSESKRSAAQNRQDPR